MKKQKLKAQVRWYRNTKNEEGYAINILTDGEWEVESMHPLVAREEGGEPDYIHWTLLNKLRILQNQGYEIDLQF